MILITGATGTNGSEIVKLLSRVGVARRALVRSSEKSDHVEAKEATGILVDVARFRHKPGPDMQSGA